MGCGSCGGCTRTVGTFFLRAKKKCPLEEYPDRTLDTRRLSEPQERLARRK